MRGPQSHLLTRELDDFCSPSQPAVDSYLSAPKQKLQRGFLRLEGTSALLIETVMQMRSSLQTLVHTMLMQDSLRQKRQNACACATRIVQLNSR